MNPARLGLVLREEFQHQIRRPLFWIMVLVLAFCAWGFSTGHVRIATGDSAAGGQKAWITSAFANARTLSVLVFLVYSFFVSVAAGMAVIQDEESGASELLHSTSLSPAEYLTGKWLGVLLAYTLALAFQVGLMLLFNHALPNADAAEFRGPLVLANYLVPALAFALPLLVFFSGCAFAVGILTRRPILVFMFPIALMVVCGFFLWDWSPSWLSLGWNRALMVLDPGGFRWLNETWLKVDRGVAFYNHSPVGYDRWFWYNRAWILVSSLGGLALASRHFAARLRSSGSVSATQVRDALAAPASGAAVHRPEGHGSLRTLGMRVSLPGLAFSVWNVARVEFRELRSQPGLYLFVPLILLQVLGSCLVAVGAFDTPLLLTPGLLAMRAMNTLTLLVCLLLLFYTVESLERERVRGFASIYHATPLPTAAILLGKALANSFVGVVVVLATFVGSAIALLVQGRVAMNLEPFLWIWGLLLVPTFLLWSSFVAMVQSATRNRFTTYGLCLAVISLTGYLQFRGKINWASNWDLWSAVRWTDMGHFELDGPALLANRLLALGLIAFFTALALRFYPRRDSDALNRMDALEGRGIGRTALALLPWLALPVAAGIASVVLVQQSFQGPGAEKRSRDYWKRNVATWTRAPIPALSALDASVELDPPTRALKVRGSFVLRNILDKPLTRFPVTGGPHWKDLKWTVDGKDFHPEERAGLFVFAPLKPLQPGDSLRLGFSFHGKFPDGVTKNGGGTGEFILKSGVVLTQFGPAFLPYLGYLEDVGVDERNRSDARDYPDDFYRGITPAGFASLTPFRCRMEISGPAGYDYHGVGVQTLDQTRNGRRTQVWESDHPVNFVNIVAGKWKVRRGNGVAVYYHPGHPYNVEAITHTLEAARKYYGEWYHPYPWKELKLSEFPGLAFYAQGFPTNITFSEGIGFLTRNDSAADAAFMVTAHEAAHQWWGNQVLPGEGPGGNILSEGMAHFATAMLFEQVRGQRGRMEFLKRIESRYGDNRVVNSEKPLVKTDGSRPGDNTVTYDKGGWVMTMLMQHIGRERCLAGLQEFMRKYSANPDHPVLQDLLETLRPFAPDTTTYDAFVRQWFFEVVVPEYKLADASVTAKDGGWQVKVMASNAGTGRMLVEVAAAVGERFPGKKKSKPSSGSSPGEYRDSRVGLVLGPGESRRITLQCGFKPAKVVVDPDVRVLQLRRKYAEISL